MAKSCDFAMILLTIRREARSETRQKVVGVSDAKIAIRGVPSHEYRVEKHIRSDKRL